MTSLRIDRVAPLLLLLLAACAGGPDTKPTDDVRAIQMLLASADHAFAAGDVEGIMRNYAPDAVLLTPGRPAMIGREEIQRFYVTMLEAFTGQHQMHSEEVVVSGDWAFDRGTVEGQIQSRAEGTIVRIDNQYVYLLHKQPDGNWKYARVIWNTRSSPTDEGGAQ